MKNKNLTISNVLSIIRIFLIPVLVYLLSLEDKDTIIIAVFLFMVISDYLDGYLARKYDQITRLGKILDPVADKLSTLVIGLGIVMFREFPVWAVAVVIMRDFVILIYSLTMMKRENVVPVSNMIGKITVSLLALSYFMYIIWLPQVGIFIIYSVIVMMIVSSISYYRNNVMKRA